MATADPIGEGMAALAHFFVGEGTLRDTLTRVAELACQALSADMAGITMLVDARAATAVFTDAEAPEIDSEQYRTGRGPCLDAWRHQVVERIEDTAVSDRWPEFSAMAASHGVRSTLSLPLSRTGEAVGALNLYYRNFEDFAGQDVARAEMWAAAAATVLANATVYHDSRALNENLRDALTSRAAIDHAIGIIMAGGGRSAEEAYQMLVRASQRENRKLRDIAADLVMAAQHRRPAPPSPRR
jgi:GAF domain-containing protein